MAHGGSGDPLEEDHWNLGGPAQPLAHRRHGHRRSAGETAGERVPEGVHFLCGQDLTGELARLPDELPQIKLRVRANEAHAPREPRGRARAGGEGPSPPLITDRMAI